VFAKWVLGKIFGSEKDETQEEWKRLHNKKMYDVYFPPNVMWVIKSRIMSWAEHVVWEIGYVCTGF
jgi:hypothetical protein